MIPIIVCKKSDDSVRKYLGLHAFYSSIEGAMRNEEPGPIFCMEHGKLISNKTLVIAKYKGFRVYNIHRADPYKYRGASVLNYQILNREKTITMVLQELLPDYKIDGGPVVARISSLYIVNKTYEEVREICRRKYPTLIEVGLTHFKSNRKCEKPNGALYKRRRPEDSELHNYNVGYNIFDRLLAADPENYPCYFERNGRRYYVKIFTPEV